MFQILDYNIMYQNLIFCSMISDDIIPENLMQNLTKLSGQKILVTGGSGFLGGYVVKELLKNGAKKLNIISPRSKNLDLRIRKNCENITKKIDLVIHLAGNVGGIGKNRKFPGTLFYDNAIMGIELMEAARKNNVKKYVTLGTVCTYPKYTPIPFKEENLWNGYPEETNAPYGLAKKMLLVQGQAYRAQFGLNAIYLLPVNLYGPGDNFDKESSHVIPALIKKIVYAKKRNDKEIVIWGSGKASREFLHVNDAARAIVLAASRYNEPDPVNIGANFEITIRELTNLVCKILDFKGNIIWDKTKPDGQPRRRLDTRLAKEKFGFVAKINFKDGLKKTIDWYLKTQGIKK